MAQGNNFFDEWERGRGPRVDVSPQTIIRVVGVLALILILLTLAFSSYFVVEPEEVGVVTRFGANHRTAQPGLHFKMPWGIEKVFLVPVKRVMKEEFGFRTEEAGVRTRYSQADFAAEKLMLTGDLNIAEVEWIVQYKIGEPDKYLFNIKHPEKALRDASEAVMREVVGDRSVTEVLTSGRVEINSVMKERMQQVLDTYECGLRIVTVKLQNVTPPGPVKASFNEVNQAKQEKEQRINQALRERNKVVPLAKGKAQQMIAEAEGFKTDRINRAQGDADRFLKILTEYKKAPDITRQRMYIETLREVLPRIRKKIITDQKGGSPLPLLHLHGDEGGGGSNVPRR